MSTFRGRLLWFFSCDLPQQGIELRFSVVAKPSKSVRQSKVAAQRASRLLNSTRLPSRFSQQLVIALNLSSMRFLQALRRLMGLSLSTRSEEQLELFLGDLQRDPNWTSEPVPAEVPRNQRRPTSTTTAS